MTTLWRCCKRTRLATAFDGEGGRHHDGRWHRPGRRIVYASDEASLALVEVLVNGWPLHHVLKKHAMTSCEFSEEHIHNVVIDELPEDWDALEPTSETQKWGDEWLSAMDHPALRVPSAIMPGTNVLINPLHPVVKKELIPAREHLEWNPRLMRVATRG